MKIRLLYCLVFCLFPITGCTQTSHIPAPWQLPGAAVGSVIENTIYEARRNKVKAYIQANYLSLKDETANNGGNVYSKLCEIANVDKNKETLLLELQNSELNYFLEDVVTEEVLEKITVTIMVHSD